VPDTPLPKGWRNTGIALATWLVTFFFDPQIYVIFSPDQFRVCQEIGSYKVRLIEEMLREKSVVKSQ